MFFQDQNSTKLKKKMLANSSSTVPLHSSSSWTSNAANWTVQIVSELEETSGGQQLLFLNLELFAVIHILGKAIKMRKLQLRYDAIVLALRKC